MFVPLLIVLLFTTAAVIGESESGLVDITETVLRRDLKPEGSAMTWQAYNRLSAILRWMEGMEQEHSPQVQLLTIGRSYQNRPLRVMKISFPGASANDEQKPAVFIDAGIHPREWITPASATFIAKKLISNLKSAPSADDNYKQFDWYILPVLNPDGYEYTTFNISQRTWRKSLSTTSNPKCLGVDMNRNFNWDWNSSYPHAASTKPCREDYRGPTAASEPEVRALQDFLVARKEIKIYVSLHSYSQLILFSWAHTLQPPEDYDNLMRVGNAAAAAIKRLYNRNYTVGQSAKALYVVSGTSGDFAKGVAGIKYSYSIELRPRKPQDTSKLYDGFHLPTGEIVEVGAEAYAAVVAMATEVAKIMESERSQTGRSTEMVDSSEPSGAVALTPWIIVLDFVMILSVLLF